MALQWCVGFCHVTTQISHNYTYITFLLSLPVLPPSYPSKSSQSAKLGSLCYTATSHQLSILHMAVSEITPWPSNPTTGNIPAAAAAAAKSLQSCLTLCDPIDGSPPGSPVPGILQTRTLEWVAISFSNAWKWKVKGKSLQSCLTLCDPIDRSPPGSPSLGFSRQEHWSGLPFPSPMHESEKTKWSRSVVSDS